MNPGPKANVPNFALLDRAFSDSESSFNTCCHPCTVAVRFYSHGAVDCICLARNWHSRHRTANYYRGPAIC
jgi:hypothetical protein